MEKQKHPIRQALDAGQELPEAAELQSEKQLAEDTAHRQNPSADGGGCSPCAENVERRTRQVESDLLPPGVRIAITHGTKSWDARCSANR